jgi:tRNA A-37 threonylcarbamoyl transferase component Bud32
VFLWLVVFPDGRVYPRWVIHLLPLLTAWETFRYMVFYIQRLPALQAIRPYGLIVTTLFTITALIAQWWRYSHIATLEQRQQTKWILLPLSVFIASSVVISALRGWSRTTGQLEIGLAIELGYTIWLLILSIFGCLALWRAITRRGLWQLDLTINRSLVAFGVTVILGIIFAGLFVVLQALLRVVLSSSQGELAVGIAAIVSALLFQQVRQRVRHVVDRQIYRLRFDLDELARKQQLSVNANAGWLTGQVVGEYELLGLIGRGGMGEVYRGYARQMQQVAAIKILKSELIGDDVTRERFHRESTITLKHPNIIKTYSYGTSGVIYYIALEYLEGPTLKDVLRERGKLTLDELRDLLPSLIDALDTAHAQGYVHRDLKPSNIGMRLRRDVETYEAVLMDFGVAKIIGRDTSITGTGAIGTIDYMSPEQINSASTVDHRADIYALGVLLYEILTGDVPFKGSVGNILFAHLRQPPPDPREKVPTLPETVANTITRAMAKNPEERFQSGREMLNAF